MDIGYSKIDLEFRNQVRQWLEQNLPVDLRDKVAMHQRLLKEDIVRWHKILAIKGWVAPAWPVEWGGTGWNLVQRYIFEEECGYAGAPQLPRFALSMCAPVLLHFGSEEQKQRFLPAIYKGDELWCQGYSEPGAGSDLASLKTRAERQNNSYIVNGQKTWTTLAHYADWMFCLVRTDMKTTKRQDGISFVLINMNSPGITIKPIILMDGGHDVNEVFFDNVKVPVENLVHIEGQGWSVAKYLLGYERMNNGRIGGSKRELLKLKKLATRQLKNGRPLLEDPRFHDRLARVEIELAALEITNLRFLDQMHRTSQPPGADVSMLKIKGSEIAQMLTELMVQAAGPFAKACETDQQDSEFDRFLATLLPVYCLTRKASIYAGSNEIQRNIIAKMALGL
jgi:alkylation response protein AidB-like acyl-CoA dehydrogenase